MKKIFLTLICVASICSNAYTQNDTVYFEWQPNGRMLTKDGADSQIVQIEGKSQEVLYNELLVAASSLFNSPKDTISSIENQLISINAIQPVIWKLGGLLGALEVKIHYVLKIHIKDNKIKIDAPYFSLLSFSTGGTQENIEGWTKTQKFFNSDGTPNNKKGKAEFIKDINSSFNALIYAIINSKNQEEW